MRPEQNAIAHAKLFQHIRLEIDQQPRTFAGDNAFGAGGWPARHHGLIADAGQVVHGMVD